MLDRQDLQAIKELVDTSVTASEERMKAYVNDRITVSEARMKSYVNASVASSELRMKLYINSSIAASEVRIDADVNKCIAQTEQHWTALHEGESIHLLADGHQNLLETLAPKERVDRLEDEVVFIKSVLKSMGEEIAKLKKAQ